MLQFSGARFRFGVQILLTWCKQSKVAHGVYLGVIAKLYQMTLNKYRKISRHYLLAREKFLEIGNSSDPLSGNDNIIGRIGKFIAFQFLIDRNPTKKDLDKNNQGFDILCDNKQIRVSVKVITDENSSGKTTKIKKEWDELILVELGKDCRILRLGHITKIQFIKAVNKGHCKLEPTCSRTMLNPKGLFIKYGQLFFEEQLKKRAWL